VGGLTGNKKPSAPVSGWRVGFSIQWRLTVSPFGPHGTRLKG